MQNEAFWQAVDTLIARSAIRIDRPKGSRHPSQGFLYELDYGYLENTTAMDGGGIDVWRGSLDAPVCDAIIVTVDLFKRDSEIKLLLGCTQAEKQLAYQFHNATELMKGLMVSR